MRRIINAALYGIPSGIFIGLCFSIYTSLQVGDGNYYPAPPDFMTYYSNDLEAMLSSVAIWGLIGVMFSVSSLIFEKDNWSILKQTLVHFLFTYIGVLLVNYLSSWFSYNIKDVLHFTIIFIGIYIVVWLWSMYTTLKNLEKINLKLKKRGETNDKIN